MTYGCLVFVLLILLLAALQSANTSPLVPTTKDTTW